MTKAIDTWHSNDRTIKSEEIAKVNFNSVCLSFSSINSNRYPGFRGLFSKYLWWNEPCSREKAPERDLWSHKQATVTFSSRRFAPHCRGRDRELSVIRYEKITSRFLACSRLSDSGEEEKEKGTRKVCGARKRKKVPPLRLSPVSSRYISAFALSRFSRLNYLGAWNRLRDSRRSK